MGVAALQLGVDMLKDVLDGEAPRLGGHLGMKDHLQQDVAEFARQVVEASLIDGLDDLIALLKQMLAQRGVRLLAVPGAALFAAQQGHNLHQPVKTAVIALLFCHLFYHALPFRIEPS